MYHYRKTRKSYKQKLTSDTQKNLCTFCHDDVMESRIVEELPHALVIRNRTRYDVWEGHSVLEHYLVIPKACVGSLNELPDDAARLEIMNIIAVYEQRGYNIYARAVGSPSRSVRHQHTHLIKFCERPQARISVYIARPYFVFDSHKIRALVPRLRPRKKTKQLKLPRPKTL